MAPLVWTSILHCFFSRSSWLAVPSMTICLVVPAGRRWLHDNGGWLLATQQRWGRSPTPAAGELADVESTDFMENGEVWRRSTLKEEADWIDVFFGGELRTWGPIFVTEELVMHWFSTNHLCEPLIAQSHDQPGLSLSSFAACSASRFDARSTFVVRIGNV